jgi:peptide/nickel transport system substrate-binding protein
MVKSNARLLRLFAVGSALALTLAACGGGNASSSGNASGSAGTGPKSGGTIYLLTQAQQWDQVDPQRIYTGEDLAFFGGTIQRSLTSYKYSADAKEGTSVVPDMATDTGTKNSDATQWKFTLRDGVTWQDGSPVTCEDVKYGVSRTFATDVINQGPTYQIAYLNIPSDAKTGASQYPGPYKATPAQQALYDKAVTCDGKTITFNLNKPVPDFNYTTTLGFSPVRKSDDKGEQYGQPGHLVVSDGPYMVQSYQTGNGGKMVLVRNPKWNKASDPLRAALPDTWEVDFGIDPKVMDQRLIASAGKDNTAIQYGNIQPENLATIFTDTEHTTAAFNGRAVSGFDPYSRYYWVNVNKVKNVDVRRAMWVALDRQAIRLNIGGAFAGNYADGVIKPNIGQDYAPTGLLDGSLDWQQGNKPKDNGDPDFAKTLIAKSGAPAPTLTFNFANTPTNAKTAAIVKSSLEKAGFTIKLAPLEPGQYYSIVFDPAKSGDFGTAGWGADWPNASTVIPPLFTQKGGWDLSQLDDATLNQAVEQAQTDTDRNDQSKKWQDLNKQVVENMWVLPTFFGLSQTLAGKGVKPIYRWPAYGSWPYGQMGVTS